MRRLTGGLLLGLTVLALASFSWAGIPSAANCTIWAERDTATVGDTVGVYVIVRDLYGEPIYDVWCYFYSDRGDTDTIIGSPDLTDINGFAEAKVRADSNYYFTECRVYVNCEGVIIGPTNRIYWWCHAGVDGLDGATVDFAMLYQNSPNPFRDFTEITYALPAPANVSLDVYDVLGKMVRALSSGAVEAGFHRAVWDGKDEVGRSVPSGIYYLRMTTAGHAETRSLMVLR